MGIARSVWAVDLANIVLVRMAPAMVVGGS
jgi:hypothetical protein